MLASGRRDSAEKPQDMDVELTDFSSSRKNGDKISNNNEEKEDDEISFPELLAVEEKVTEETIPSRPSRFRRRLTSVNIGISIEDMQRHVTKYLQTVGKQQDMKQRREQRLITAAFGEFMSSLVFYTTVFSYRVNVTANNIPYGQAALPCLVPWSMDFSLWLYRMLFHKYQDLKSIQLLVLLYMLLENRR